MAPEDIPKTAVTTPFVLFEFLGMHFGLRKVAQIFQHFIDTVLHDLDFVCAYIDDILIACNSSKEYCQHLKMVFRHLDEYGITINP